MNSHYWRYVGTWARGHVRHISTWVCKARWNASTQGTLAPEHVSMKDTLTVEHVSTQDMLARKRWNMQCTLSREHVSTQGTLAREHVSKQGPLVREHVFSTYGKQFSRLEFKILARTSLNSLHSCTHVLWYTTISTMSHFVWEIFENLWYRCMYHRKNPVFVKAIFLENYQG